MSRSLADAAARARLRDDLDTTFVVEAAAGTGKTTALVDRVVASLAAGRSQLDRTVVVTFTDAAAGELKLRLRAAIEGGRRDERRPAEERERLRAAVLQLEAARIGTIHSFCAELLRERPVEARVDPQFQVAADTAAELLFDRVFDRWFERQLADPGPGVRRVLRRPQRFGAANGPRATLRQAARDLLAWRDFPTPWARRPFDRDAEIDALMADLDALGPEPSPTNERDFFGRSLHAVAAFTAEVRRRERLGGRDYDGLEAQLIDLDRQRFMTWRGWIPRNDPQRMERRERRDAVKQRLEAFVEACGADLAPLLREDVWPVVEDYERMKARAGCLDFVDLLLRARNLVRDDRHVRSEYQRRFTHLYVDEFQDTDPLQAELLLLLAADDPACDDWRRVRPVPGKLFIVGDPKQSIYRFRRADVGLYEQVKRQLLAVGADLLHLTVSFRSLPAIQQLVNAAFAPRMTGSTSTQAAYVPLEPHRDASVAQPAVVALPVPRPYGDYGKPVAFRIDASLPDAVAAFVSWLIGESGWTVAERVRGDDRTWREDRVPVRPRHVCLLFRRLQSFGEDVTRPYVRALEARQLRHVLVGGSSFHAREEIAALRTALGAVERPDDEMALFATLRGPLFALDDGVLLAYRHQFKTLHPFRTLPEQMPIELLDVGEALAVLRELHRARNRRPFAETLARLLGATRAPAGFAIWPTGEQALANVGRLLDMARRADRQGLTSFRAFVEWLEREAETGDAGEAPLLEDGADGVRVMTVHKAKGLEFPVVILADLTAHATAKQPARWVDGGRGVCALRLAGCLPAELQDHAAEEMAREREEADRVLYVAATRARDLLVVPAVGDGPFESWLDALYPVLYPPLDRAAVPLTTTPAGCPPLGGDSVLERSPRTSRPDGSVTPGLHHPASGTHEVVWWAPRALGLDLEENLGLRQQKLLQADEGGARSTEGVRRHDAWQRTRAELRERGKTPRLVVATATERAGTEAGAGDDVRVETVPVAAERPHGPRFGTLVHAVLATVDLTADADAVRRLAEIEGRILRASADEVAAAATAVSAALCHPLLARAAALPCRRETPIVMPLADGTVLEGVIDAAFEDGDGWTVVDFKTDVELESRLHEYRAQVWLYVRAVAEATGRPARGVLLRV